jgi:hypothetical protein
MEDLIPTEEMMSNEEDLENIPEIKILEKIYDREQTKTHLKISIGAPFNAFVYKSGGLGRICFQLVEQFGLAISPKALAEVLTSQLASAKFRETSVEESIYYSFHSWLIEKGIDFFAKGQIWYHTDKNNKKQYVRITSEPMKVFFATQGILDRNSREGVLSYWREKGWLRPGGERRLNKNVRITFPNGEKGFVQVYEILISKDLPVDEEEDAPTTPAL